MVSPTARTNLPADRVLVIDGGVIAQSGTHDDLVAQEGLYRPRRAPARSRMMR